MKQVKQVSGNRSEEGGAGLESLVEGKEKLEHPEDKKKPKFQMVRRASKGESGKSPGNTVQLLSVYLSAFSWCC